MKNLNNSAFSKTVVKVFPWNSSGTTSVFLLLYIKKFGNDKYVFGLHVERTKQASIMVQCFAIEFNEKQNAANKHGVLFHFKQCQPKEFLKSPKLR